MLKCPTGVLITRLKEHANLPDCDLGYLIATTQNLSQEAADELERLQDLLRDALPYVEKMPQMLLSSFDLGIESTKHLAKTMREASKKPD